MLLASIVSLIALGSVVLVGILGYLIDKNADDETDDKTAEKEQDAAELRRVERKGA